jgi:hypothetical protein
MLDTEDDARQLLATAAEDVPPGIDLLAGVRKRQAARRRRTRAVLVATAAAVLAAGTTVALTVSQTPSALAALAAAATRTAAQSYRVTATSSATYVPPRDGTGTFTVSGIFNSAQGIGEENGGRTRFVGGYMYTYLGMRHTGPYRGKSWLKFPAFPMNLTVGKIPLPMGEPEMQQGVNPADLLAALKSVSQVREIGPASGAGWTGSQYAFTWKLGGSRFAGVVSSRFVGTVDVDQQGRVRHFGATLTTAFRPPNGAFVQALTMSFTDFGVALAVTAPPASEVYTFPPPPAVVVPPLRG